MAVSKQDILTGKIQSEMTFNEKVWTLCSRIPRGQVTTYGRIAAALGDPRSSRAVGGALNRNPFAPDVPCHRVVGSTGALTGFFHGIDRKREMLREEGVAFAGDAVDLSDCFKFEGTQRKAEEPLFAMNR